jgi:hypothetical protein
MRLIEFPGQNVVIAKDQPQYEPLPAYRVPSDAYGRLVCCWKLSWRERLRLLWSGEVWHTIMTFNRQLQPQLLALDRPEYVPDEETSEA